MARGSGRTPPRRDRTNSRRVQHIKGKKGKKKRRKNARRDRTNSSPSISPYSGAASGSPPSDDGVPHRSNGGGRPYRRNKAPLEFGPCYATCAGGASRTTRAAKPSRADAARAPVRPSMGAHVPSPGSRVRFQPLTKRGRFGGAGGVRVQKDDDEEDSRTIHDCPHVSSHRVVNAITADEARSFVSTDCDACYHDADLIGGDSIGACGVPSLDHLWLCMLCKQVFCGRRGHMLRHFESTGHDVTICLDGSKSWCYSCDSYIVGSKTRLVKAVLSRARPVERRDAVHDGIDDAADHLVEEDSHHLVEEDSHHLVEEDSHHVVEEDSHHLVEEDSLSEHLGDLDKHSPIRDAVRDPSPSPAHPSSSPTSYASPSSSPPPRASKISLLQAELTSFLESSEALEFREGVSTIPRLLNDEQVENVQSLLDQLYYSNHAAGSEDEAFIDGSGIWSDEEEAAIDDYLAHLAISEVAGKDNDVRLLAGITSDEVFGGGLRNSFDLLDNLHNDDDDDDDDGGDVFDLETLDARKDAALALGIGKQGGLKRQPDVGFEGALMEEDEETDEEVEWIIRPNRGKSWSKKREQKKKKREQKKKQKRREKQKRRRAMKQTIAHSLNLYHTQRTIVSFVDSGRKQIELDGTYPPFQRKQIHMLCELYGIESTGVGSGSQKRMVLRRTGDTFIPDSQVVNNLISSGYFSGAFGKKAKDSPRRRRNDGNVVVLDDDDEQGDARRQMKSRPIAKSAPSTPCPLQPSRRQPSTPPKYPSGSRHAAKMKRQQRALLVKSATKASHGSAGAGKKKLTKREMDGVKIGGEHDTPGMKQSFGYRMLQEMGWSGGAIGHGGGVDLEDNESSEGGRPSSHHPVVVTVKNNMQGLGYA